MLQYGVFCNTFSSGHGCGGAISTAFDPNPPSANTRLAPSPAEWLKDQYRIMRQRYKSRAWWHAPGRSRDNPQSEPTQRGEDRMQIKIGLGAFFVLGLCLAVTGQTMANVAGTQNPTAAPLNRIDIRGTTTRTSPPASIGQNSSTLAMNQCRKDALRKCRPEYDHCRKRVREIDPRDKKAWKEHLRICKQMADRCVRSMCP